jgi:predicted dehydrogenase
MSTILGAAAKHAVPRLGFLGVGWIGRMRMESLIASGAGRVVALADAAVERLGESANLAPEAHRAGSLDELLDLELDGVVIATPSALHAQQSIKALERGVAVFCQKPLARTAAEASAVVAAARAADRLLGVDLSYRFTSAMQAIRHTVRSGSVGDVYGANLVFHNAYGPDRGWARNPELAGGGCVIDLGVHLVDLALWTLGFPRVTAVSSHLHACGERLRPGQSDVCEDHAVATLELANGAVVRIACSWECSTGQDAVIEARFTGTRGAAALRNVNGSFYDFMAELHRGTTTTSLAVPPDDWGGRALIDWSRRIGAGGTFDPDVETAVTVAATLDAILGR